MLKGMAILFALSLSVVARGEAVSWDPSSGCDAEYSGSQCESLVGDEGPMDGGGKYAYCIAKRSQGQQCRDVVTLYTGPGTLCATGCRVCASVQFSASCNCDDNTLELTGTCSYW